MNDGRPAAGRLSANGLWTWPVVQRARCRGERNGATMCRVGRETDAAGGRGLRRGVRLGFVAAADSC